MLKRHHIITLITVLATFLIYSLPLNAISQRQLFSNAWHNFHRLEKNPSRAKYRSSWLKLKKQFQRVYRQNPRSSFAAKSLYYLGRTYEELARRSNIKNDFYQALHYYQRVVNQFPHHRWTDDAIFRRAVIYKKYLKDSVNSYSELLKIVHKYSNGDMYKKAQKELQNLDKKYIQTHFKSRKIRKKIITQNIRNKLSRLVNIRYATNNNQTFRIVADFSKKIKYCYNLLTYQKLKEIFKFYIDFFPCQISQKIKNIHINHKYVDSFTLGYHQPAHPRLVININKHPENINVFALNSPYRIVMDFMFQQAKNHGKPHNVFFKRPKLQLTTNNIFEQLGLSIHTIMIDPGHGGHDPGAKYHGIMEKDINLKMARILGYILSKHGYNVLYTRTKDKYLTLQERAQMANLLHADLFISIHCNANPKRYINGLEIYYLNFTKNKEAIRIAARENASVNKKISDLRFILADLLINSKINESADFARILNTSLKNYLRRHYPGFRNNGVKKAPFYVLLGTQMPSILIELGYLSNSKDRHLLANPNFLSRIAYGILKGIQNYQKQIQIYAWKE